MRSTEAVPEADGRVPVLVPGLEAAELVADVAADVAALFDAVVSNLSGRRG